ncbi:MAG: hypothetical protein HW375_1451 [Anaerolineales bacterium]|nr:hypothetical protein [Anaerolineales bacterium]
MTEVQVIFWRDIPAQVKARQDRERAARGLDPRFQEAVDAAAMRAGLADTDNYLAEWRTSTWEERPGSPEQAADQHAAEIEAEYSAERLRLLVDNGGREL